MTIRKLEDSIKVRLRIRAATHGHSMEEEVREILRVAVVGLEAPPQENLAQAIRRQILPEGGVELNIPKRQAIRKPPSF